MTQQTKFSNMGNSIMGRMDEMGKRMDELESSIAELMDQAGLENPESPLNSPRTMSPNARARFSKMEAQKRAASSPSIFAEI
jgi:Heat shock factor binding protein 1